MKNKFYLLGEKKLKSSFNVNMTEGGSDRPISEDQEKLLEEVWSHLEVEVIL